MHTYTCTHSTSSYNNEGVSATVQTVCDSEETTSGWALNNIIMQIAAAKFYEEIIIIGLATLHNVIIHEQQNKDNF